jgi:hypothetical protein
MAKASWLNDHAQTYAAQWQLQSRDCEFPKNRAGCLTQHMKRLSTSAADAVSKLA